MIRIRAVVRCPPTTACPYTPDVPERLGVFGGTFDPPHVGHLVTAVNVRHTLHLDRVLFVVAGMPWQKEGSRPITPAADRLWLVEEAVRDVAGLEASDVEVARGGRSYTADTLAALAKRHPSATLFTILGEDAAAGFLTWERYEEVARRSVLVVVDRPGFVADLPGGFDWVHVEVPHLEVSSTDLRARVEDGRPLEFLLTPPVIEGIRARRLYGMAA
jgi:nicotinate-nucleotide adenylyltransferase